MMVKKRTAFLEIIKALLLVIALGVIGFLASSCKSDDNTPIVIEKVLLVYLAGDNNLSEESDEKLRAMVNGYKGQPNQRILVYQDYRGGTPKLLEIDGKNKTEILENYSSENSADPVVLSRVITKAKSLYPSAKFNFLVFSHATGWLPEKSYTNPTRSVFNNRLSSRSILVDENSEMDLTDFAQAIPNNMFEHIIFEACHMAGIEVAYELRNKAKYISASSAEIVSPGFTYVYTNNINHLVNNSTKEFMQAAFNYFDNQNGYLHSATFSMIATANLESLADFIRGNCDFSRTMDVENIQHFDRNSYYLFCDFEDYYSRLLEDDKQQTNFNKLIEQNVIWKASTPYFMEGYKGFPINKHSGLTAYIMQDRYPNLNKNYKNLAWYKAIMK